jgi:endonuclease/exonuclease/phosphatase (EEP) superfamily protein YafD
MTTATAWDTTHRPARAGQGVLLAVAGLFAVPAVASTALRLVPPADDTTALAAAFIAYGLIAYAVVLVCLLIALVRARRRAALVALTGLTAVLTAGHLAWLGPSFVPNGRPVATEPFTVLTLNIRNGRADPAALADQAAQADVVVLVETTSAAQVGLAAEGWDARFPYAVGDPRREGSNTAVFSRFRLSRGTMLGRSNFSQWSVAVEVPDLGLVRLLAVHPCNPYCGGGRWYIEHEVVRAAVATHGTGPLLVAGDFNAVAEHGPMQRLHRLGLRSATDLVGGGWLPTYPVGGFLPPLIPIDHVLLNEQLTATAVTAVTVPGTDHRGLLVRVAGAG